MYICMYTHIYGGRDFDEVCCFEQVYQLSIGAACGLSWPSDRIIIQVLDDSTDHAIKVIKSSNPFNLNTIYNDDTFPLL